MNLFAVLVLSGWVPLTILFFLIGPPHRAALLSVLGGVLFLPMGGFNFPGVPPVNKYTVIGIGLFLGGVLSGHRFNATVRWGWYDFPLLLWCICPLLTSLANGLGWYDGIAGVWGNFVLWGLPYMAGRIYFDSADKLFDLCRAILVGGLLYVPLILFELRMSPQLSNIFYGFFPHSFDQHYRYGGYRPIVFMQHALMVALWMAVTSTTAFWLWRSKLVAHIKGIPISFIFLVLAILTVLCKSANGWFILVLGCGGYFAYQLVPRLRPFRLLLIFIPVYCLLRITGMLEATTVESFASQLLDAERVDSLVIRLVQEDLFVAKTLEQPLLGWGGYERGWPIDPQTGRKAVQMIDALWLIAFNTRGALGLAALLATMMVGPWMVLRGPSVRIGFLESTSLVTVLLSLVVLMFMVDTLFNGMINTMFILASGALCTYGSTVASEKR